MERENNVVETEERKSSKKVVISVLAVLVLVLAVVGITYAFFTYSKLGTTENTISTGTIVFSYNEAENGINITDAVPMTDAEGDALTGSNNVFDFNVTGTIVGNTTVGYEIVLIDITTDDSTVVEADKLDPKYVKVQLTRVSGGTTESGKILNHFSLLDDSLKVTGAKTITTGSIVGDDTGDAQVHNYRLRMWLADTDASGTATTMRDDYTCTAEDVADTDSSCSAVDEVIKGTNNKTFKIKVGVHAATS